MLLKRGAPMHRPCVGGRSSTPSSLPSCLNDIHLTCSGFVEHAPILQKRPLKNPIQPCKASSDGYSPTPSAEIEATVLEPAFRNTSRQSFFDFPFMRPVVSQPVTACHLHNALALASPSAP